MKSSPKPNNPKRVNNSTKKVVNKTFYRVGRFANILTSYAEFEYLRQIKKTDKASLGAWIKQRFETMGTTFTKIGQLMSTRTDVFGEEITDQLKELQDNVSPLPFHALESSIIGRDQFSEIDPKPIASASIGQVHVGRLKNSDAKIALKLKRPGIEQQIIDDFEMLLFGLNLLRRFSDDRKLNEFQILFNEYFKILKEEINFEREAENMMVFKDMFKKQPWVKVPTLYKHLSNSDVITMEYAPSIKIDDVSTMDWMNFDREKIAQKLVELFVKQVIDHGVVHIDPHPGNVGISDKGQITFYDFGMVVNIDPDTRSKFKSFIVAIYDKDIESMCNVVISMGLVVIEPKDIPYLKVFLVSFLSYIESADLEQFKVEYVNKLNSYSTPFLISSKFILLLRGFSILEGVCKKLDPNFNFKKTLDPYIDEFIIDVNYLESRALNDIKMMTRVPDNVQMNKLQIEVLENTVRDVEKQVKQEQTNQYSTLLACLAMLVLYNELDLNIITALALGLTCTIIINGKVHSK